MSAILCVCSDDIFSEQYKENCHFVNACLCCICLCTKSVKAHCMLKKNKFHVSAFFCVHTVELRVNWDESRLLQHSSFALTNDFYFFIPFPYFGLIFFHTLLIITREWFFWREKTCLEKHLFICEWQKRMERKNKRKEKQNRMCI